MWLAWKLRAVLMLTAGPAARVGRCGVKQHDAKVDGPQVHPSVTLLLTRMPVHVAAVSWEVKEVIVGGGPLCSRRGPLP